MKLKKLGLVFILIGLLLAVFATIGMAYGILNKAHQIICVILGVPLLFAGISMQFIQSTREKRKKPTIVLLSISLGLITMGALSKYVYYWFGSNVEVIVGVFIFCFGFAPLMTKFRYEKWSQFIGSSRLAYLLSITDFIIVAMIFVGLLFKMMHWPGAEFMLIVGGCLLPITIIVWNRVLGQQLVLRKTAEENLKTVHHELKEKSDEILDSIAYAKRIQTAILPSEKILKELLPNSFVLYLPKDVVAGDFYWMQKIDNKVFFAAADCTGHGVPGAMVSVICNNALNRAVKEFNKRTPAEILDQARDIVIQEFDKSEEDVKDGMDLALCSISGRKLEYAGAHNPLWIIRNKEIIEFKADKQPIGNFEMAKPFTNHEFDLELGDLIYIFSDGYVDQFGGVKGKKFKPKKFRELLLNIHQKPLDEQARVLKETIVEWRGDLEQVDDICVLGVRI
ncbi:MAG: serine phosphatase RsbU (regulator of sigma subunit) [Crocinitomix sp.]